MPSQVIRNRETGEQFVGDGPVPEGYEVVTKPAITEADIGARWVREGQAKIPPSLTDMAKGSVMPTLGAIGGGMLGKRIAGQPGQMAGEMAGSTLGTGANMAAGLQPPSVGALAESAAAPLQGRLFGQATQFGAGQVAKVLPGSAAARHEIAKSTMAAIPDLIQPGTPSSILYKQLEQQGQAVYVTPTHLRTTVQELLDAESRMLPGLKDSSRKSMLEAMLGEIADPQKTLTFTDYWANVKRIGEKVGALQTSGGEALGAAKVLYKAAQKDLDAAGSINPALKTANRAWKMEKAAEELSDVTTKSLVPRADGLIRVDPVPVRKWLRDSDFAGFLDPAQRTGIEQVLKQIERLPAIPPQRGINFGAGPTVARGAMGTGGGMFAGLDPASAALVGGVAAYGPQLVSRALMTEPGRKALMMVLDRGPMLDYPKLAALAVAINAGAKAEGQSPEPGTKVRLGTPREPERETTRIRPFDISTP